MNASYTLNIILLIASVSVIKCLRIKRLDVPKSVLNGSSVDLICDFDLEGETLYSVRWYKNFVEFYRFLPSNFPESAETMGMKGNDVDVTRSNSTNVHLATTDLDSQGLYTCEVSTESPSYSSLRQGDIMQVYVLPLEKTAVKIDGSALNTRLDSGDFINLTCVSGPSFPAATLTWFINGDQAGEDQVIQYPIQVLMNGLQRRRLGLFVQASSSLFSPGGLLKLRCSAALLLTYEFEALRILTPASAFDSRHTHHHHHGHQTAARNLHQLQRTNLHSSIDVNAIDQEGESYADAGAFYLTQGNSGSPASETPLIESRGASEHRSGESATTASLYRIGDWIDLNCSASGDLAHLRWFINDKDVSSPAALRELQGEEEKGDHEEGAKNYSYKRSTAGGRVRKLKGHSALLREQSDTSDRKWTLPLRFQLRSGQLRSDGIKLRCLANYHHTIKDYSTSLTVASYNYQAIEAQSTSSASSCNIGSCSSTLLTLILLIALMNQLPSIYLQITYLTAYLSELSQVNLLSHYSPSPSSIYRRQPPPPPPPPLLPPSSSSSSSSSSSPLPSSLSPLPFNSSPGSCARSYLFPLKDLPSLMSSVSSIMCEVSTGANSPTALCSSQSPRLKR